MRMQIWVGSGRVNPAFLKMLTNLGITWVIKMRNAENRNTTTMMGYVSADLISDLTLCSCSIM